ncbi:MAG: glycosyltransferase family 2 protein [Pseudomonadota bacterium]
MIGIDELTITVIIPVYNGGTNFRRCLASVNDTVPPPDEVIVVSDGDTDGSWRMAEEFGATVIRLGISGGPARARNIGASASKGNILFFVDADVTIPSDTIGKLSKAFQGEPDMAALFGSYDDAPAETNFLSQYKNLFHHYVHQTGREDASTFWAGCGAIRREIFLSMGGFDERYFHHTLGGRPGTSEDIELGYRLKRSGCRIRLLKDLQVKHWKRWGAASLVKADFFYRALPWTGMILREGRFVNDLNIKMSSRLSVISLYLLLLCLPAAWIIPWFFIPALFLAAGMVGLNWDLYRFFKNKRGWVFALKTIPWHWFYFLYSGLAFAIGLAHYKSKNKSEQE